MEEIKNQSINYESSLTDLDFFQIDLLSPCQAFNYRWLRLLTRQCTLIEPMKQSTN